MRQFKLLVILCVMSFAVSCGQQKKYISYKVKEGETMRNIANKLDMKTKDLLRLNPDVGRRPKANTVIIIPNKNSGALVKEVEKKEDETKIDSVSVDTNVDVDSLSVDELKKEFIIHTVKKGDTFFSLTRFYNVSEEELKTLNPELVDGLKVDAILKIKKIEIGDENEVYVDVIEREDPINLAILLPFRANQYDSIKARDIFRKSRLANIVTDFYLGAEIAIDSIRAQGIDVNVSLFDTERRNSKIRTILSENDFDNTDVIIGPIYSDEAKIVANRVKAPVVFPVFSNKQKEFSSSRLIKTSPDKENYTEELENYLSTTYKGENIIVVSDSTSVANGVAYKFTTALRKNDSIQSVPVLKPNKGYITKDRFLELLKPNIQNWIVILTQENDVVADAINSLISLPEDVTAKVFTTVKGNAYNKVANNKLGQIGFTYVTDTYIDESSFATQSFNAQYLKKNYAMPSSMATKGFDITYDVLMRLASDKGLKNTFKDGSSYRLESKFSYSKKLFDSTDNMGLFIVQYNPDLTLTRLK